MARLVLIHWKPGELPERVARLETSGHRVDTPQLGGGSVLRVLVDDPPDAFVVDLGRAPSQGRDLGAHLRERASTRKVPLLFVGGAADKVAQVRELLPDAAFSSWDEVESALASALANPPRDPVAPGVFAGYSGTPLPRKLGISSGRTVVLVDAPDGFESILGVLPGDVRIRRQARGPAEVVLLFAGSRSHLERRFESALRATADRGLLWIAWPKKASGVATDLTQAEVRRHGLDRGLVDSKIASLDATWSGLRFTRRR